MKSERLLDPMRPGRLMRARTGSGTVWIATVMLVGVVLMGAGYLQGKDIPLYAGVFVTLAGVLGAIVRLVTRGAL
jgi:hypothetical protein